MKAPIFIDSFIKIIIIKVDMLWYCKYLCISIYNLPPSPEKSLRTFLPNFLLIIDNHRSKGIRIKSDCYDEH